MPAALFMTRFVASILQSGNTAATLRWRHAAQRTQERIEGEVMVSCGPGSRMDELRMGLQKDMDNRKGILRRVIEGAEVAEAMRSSL